MTENDVGLLNNFNRTQDVVNNILSSITNQQDKLIIIKTYAVKF